MIISHCHLIAEKKTQKACTRRVNTETLTSLASETNYASYMKKNTNSEKYEA
jgi:hypothetical protein